MTGSQEWLLPETNLEAFRLIFSLEVGLRELVIEELFAIGGRDWYKRHLPGDVLEKYKSARHRERQMKWIQYAHHDPLYYVDFPDLAKIIESAANWNAVFASIFGRKDIFLSSLRATEEVRNKVAHNRLVTDGDIAILTNAYQQFLVAVGRSRARELVVRGAKARTSSDLIRGLKTELFLSYQECCDCGELSPRTHWNAVRCSSWLGIVAIEHDVGPLETTSRF
jgi:hypothetical protein